MLEKLHLNGNNISDYGMGAEISAKGDVYSYGILLLELFSGKRPTESSILPENGNNLHDYVRKAIPQRVMDIADPRIVLVQEELGLTVNQSYSRATNNGMPGFHIEVGISCSEETPRKRIDIRVAVKGYKWQETKFCSAFSNKKSLMDQNKAENTYEKKQRKQMQPQLRTPIKSQAPPPSRGKSL
nr:PREDICTED: probable LRR receptor-like serine/threonine-protein kinase At3g47570 isoform X3 [Daucus carota subsp. sativus]